MILMRIAVNCPDEMDHVRNGSIGDYEIATAIALQTTGTSSRSSDWLR